MRLFYNLDQIIHSLCERLAHPRRGWKPEFKLERYPPLDGASCSPWLFRKRRRSSNRSRTFVTALASGKSSSNTMS